VGVGVGGLAVDVGEGPVLSEALGDGDGGSALHWEGDGEGVSDGVGVGEGVSAGQGEELGPGFGFGLGLSDEEADTLGLCDGEGLGQGEPLGEGVAVGLGVSEGVSVGVGEGDEVSEGLGEGDPGGQDDPASSISTFLCGVASNACPDFTNSVSTTFHNWSTWRSSCASRSCRGSPESIKPSMAWLMSFIRCWPSCVKWTMPPVVTTYW
jgi:hypothetical protein